MTEFVYDGLRRLRIRKEYDWKNSAWVPVKEVRYVYDGNLVIQERDALNLPQVTYTRGLDLSGTLQGAGGIGGLLARTESSGNLQQSTAYYHADGNGNITALIDAQQNIVAKYQYDPFGSLISSTGPKASANLYRFSSKEFHSSSGLYSFGYRFYDPKLQRWINRDPIAEAGGVNLYAFVHNSPLDSFDPFGLQGNPVRYVQPPAPVNPMLRQIELELEIHGRAHPREMFSRRVRDRMTEEFLARRPSFPNTTIGASRSEQLKLPLEPVNLTPREISQVLGTFPCPTGGGRRGSDQTRDQLDALRDEFLHRYPHYRHEFGGRDAVTGEPLREFYLRPIGGGRKGGSYPDLSFRAPDGSMMHVNTVDITRSGLMTPRELGNYARIFEQTGGRIMVVPKQ